MSAIRAATAAIRRMPVPRAGLARFSSGPPCPLASQTPSTEPLVVSVELVSDTLWPNGYIGKRHLHRAIEEVLSNPAPGAPRPLRFSVLRVPFFLEGEYDESKVFEESNRERLVKKWGGQAGWERQKRGHDLKGRGRAAGIPKFNLDRLAANSMASHRLIQHVGKRFGLTRSESLYDRLNVYYFVDGHSLNDRPRLADVAAEHLREHGVDMDAQEILVFLESNEGRAEIQAALATLHRMGVHSIPQFIVEGSRVVQAGDFEAVFREIEARGEVDGGPLFADILGVDAETVRRGSHRVAGDAA